MKLYALLESDVKSTRLLSMNLRSLADYICTKLWIISLNEFSPGAVRFPSEWMKLITWETGRRERLQPLLENNVLIRCVLVNRELGMANTNPPWFIDMLTTTFHFSSKHFRVNWDFEIINHNHLTLQMLDKNVGT